MPPDTPRGITRVWDAGAVAKNRDVLCGHGQRNAALHMRLFSQDGHGKEAGILLTRLIICNVLEEGGILFGPHY